MKWKDYLQYWDVIILLIISGFLAYNYFNQSEIMINIILLFISAFAVEKFYVSRAGVLPNILVIYFIFRSAQIPVVLNYYLVIGFLLGVFSLYFYLIKQSLPNFLYSVTYLLYGLKTILPLYLTYLLIGLTFDIYFSIIFLAILFAVWVFGVFRAGNKLPISF